MIHQKFNHQGYFSLSFMAIVLATFFASCNNCPDYPIEPDVLRFLPYQANQTVVFEDATQNLDTLTVSSFSRGFDTETCADHPSQDFEYERIHVTLGTIAGDSTFVLLDNTTWEKLSIRFQDSDLGPAFEPLSGTLDHPIGTNYETFTFQASEVVNGTTYQNVSTYTKTYYNPSHIETVKLAIDHGIVAFQTDLGVWWYLH